MTPQEKAKELLNKMTTNAHSLIYKNQYAKECALIAVDEILNNFGQLTNGANFYTSYDAVKYWQEVKQELEKL